MSVVAARSMAAGEVVLSVPASLHVTSYHTAADVEPFDKDKVGGSDAELVEVTRMGPWHAPGTKGQEIMLLSVRKLCPVDVCLHHKHDRILTYAR